MDREDKMIAAAMTIIALAITALIMELTGTTDWIISLFV
jgi:hypothetical protein